MNTDSTYKTACILCSRNCGLTVEVENGQFKRVRGDDDHPISKGYICQKAARLEHYQSHSGRLTQPLKRMSDGTFEAVSWDDALSDIASRLLKIRRTHGGKAFAFAGGGGQGNHLGAAYSRQLRAVMGSPYAYNSLAQEKTGDFWVNGRLFGHQTCHTTEDVEHADFVLFIGCNPFQSHGIPNARDTLKEIRKNVDRRMVVIDPRRTETAKQADIHLQLKPGTDAFLLSAMLAIIVRENWHDAEFLARHCTGFDAVERTLLEAPIEDYVRRADVPMDDVRRVAKGFAEAASACVRIDLGIQQTLHCTLNGYLEKLLYLLTGNFGRKGCNNLHTMLFPVLGHSEERPEKSRKPVARTAYHGMHAIGGLFPPNILPDEILLAGEDRIRAVVVDSSNPLLTWADTAAFEKAFASLDLLVVVDVALTETARLAHYVLPAASQFEKCEATGFNLEFPENFFHLRHPIFSPIGEALPEPEIYTRLLQHMGAIPTTFPVLERVARWEPKGTNHSFYLAALAAALSKNKAWRDCAASIVYMTLGKAMPSGLAAAAPVLALALDYARRYPAQVRRAGIKGPNWLLGQRLFQTILDHPEGCIISRHGWDEIWSLVRTPDGRIHLAIDEMLDALGALSSEAEPDTEWPFILFAGERRSYNANQIYRDETWRKVDPHGALRIHPDDAEHLDLQNGSAARCQSATGDIPVIIELDDAMRRGVVALPHGYGQRTGGAAPVGPALNLLTSGGACEPFTKTPYHKYVPVRILAS